MFLLPVHFNYEINKYDDMISDDLFFWFFFEGVSLVEKVKKQWTQAIKTYRSQTNKNARELHLVKCQVHFFLKLGVKFFSINQYMWYTYMLAK